MLKHDTISCRIRGVVSSYLERYGIAYIGLYRFTDMASVPDWTTYLTVLNITLNREGLRPSHLWIRNGNDRLLLLCVSGYFRSCMDDVTDILTRLWVRRVPCGIPPVLIRSWRAETPTPATWSVTSSTRSDKSPSSHATNIGSAGSEAV